MRTYRLERTQIVPVSPLEAWAFFADPRNLPLITPPSLGLRITGELPPEMHPGMLITYRLTPFPFLPVTWVTEITQIDAPRLFVDEQRAGPYRFWHHEHHFRPVAAGTEARDVVTYALPFGPLGRPAAGVVRRQLEGIFDFRRRFLEQHFPR